MEWGGTLAGKHTHSVSATLASCLNQAQKGFRLSHVNVGGHSLSSCVKAPAAPTQPPQQQQTEWQQQQA